jgi:glycosyltransferase involved in cell wall biosynthesis
VLDSSFTVWELVIVGDGCTDDTAEEVASFGDGRIRFVNLPRRSGDQSLPHNHGVALARGRYIAFLNHDDLYLPDHLATCVAELDRSGADLVWAACANLLPATDPPAGERRFALASVPTVSGYSPSDSTSHRPGCSGRT